MTPRQRQIARNALGLPNADRRSYRNRYFPSSGTGTWNEWVTMVRAGWAIQFEKEGFYLTRAGALMALDEGEELDPEDFPSSAQGEGRT